MTPLAVVDEYATTPPANREFFRDWSKIVSALAPGFLVQAAPAQDLPTFNYSMSSNVDPQPNPTEGFTYRMPETNLSLLPGPGDPGYSEDVTAQLADFSNTDVYTAPSVTEDRQTVGIGWDGNGDFQFGVIGGSTYTTPESFENAISRIAEGPAFTEKSLTLVEEYLWPNGIPKGDEYSDPDDDDDDDDDGC